MCSKVPNESCKPQELYASQSQTGWKIFDYADCLVMIAAITTQTRYLIALLV